MKPLQKRKPHLFLLHYHLISLLLFLISFHLYSQPDATFTPGQIIDTVKCLDDLSQSYALYLPSYYTPDQRWPMVYLFEPAARGSLPLHNFREAVEKYGYIVLCSNNSRNGPWEPMIDAANAMLKDSQRRFPVNTDRIYFGGFSGGSRAASVMAVLMKKAAGVIACGAGLSQDPHFQPEKNPGFSYVGMVGNTDMNYREMQDLQGELTGLGIPHKLIVFDGTHEWPPSGAIVEAFDWLELQAMKKGFIPVNDSLITGLFNKTMRQAHKDESSGKEYEALQIYQAMVPDFDGLREVTAIKDKITRLNAMKSVQKAIKENDDLAEKERRQQILCWNAIDNNINNRLDSASVEWWKNELRYIDILTRSSDSAKAWMGQRLRQIILYSCSKQASDNAKSFQYQKAINAYRIISMTVPSEVYPFFELAKEYAITNRPDQALENLQKAVDNGLSDSHKMTDNPVFNNLRNDKRYQKILQQMKSR
jgi:dienelactone hydrolase